MLNCKYCGGQINGESKFCEYCGRVVNETGKDFTNGGNAFLITSIFKISNRLMVIGKPLQYIKTGDVLYFNGKAYTVLNMQVGQTVTSSVGPQTAQVGIVFENYDINGLKKGDTLIFKEEEK